MHSTHTAVDPIRRIRVVLSATPVALLTYALFVIAVTLMDFVFLPFAPEAFRASFIPYTGWLLSGSYAFTIAFAGALIFQRQRRTVIRFGITLILLVQIATGGYMQWREFGRPDFGNPYLMVSAWRLIWTVVVPGVWIILLHTRRMNFFCRETGQAAGSKYAPA
jgi:hypothetical protein